MRKDIYFDDFFGPGWPKIDQLEPYFLGPIGQKWFNTGGNDSGNLTLEGADGTANLPRFQGRIDITLAMWGNPSLGVLLIYSKFGGGKRVDFTSKGNMTKLKTWVRTLHDDPMPVGLFIPFPRAWLAVKEFIETEGQLPTSIEWVRNTDLPEGTFPDP
jgi:Immunity protein Imm1